MAKSRKTTRKVASSRTRAATRTAKRPGKTARGKKSAAARKSAAPARDVLDLKKLRKELERAVGSLAKRSEKSGDGRTDKAQTLMTRWVSEIDEICDEQQQEICGPTMAIPLG